MCAGQPDRDHDGLLDAGNDACHGDSGGPLVCNIGGSAVLYGVVSWGIRCSKQGAPGVYVNIMHISHWIRQKIAEIHLQSIHVPSEHVLGTDALRYCSASRIIVKNSDGYLRNGNAELDGLYIYWKNIDGKASYRKQQASNEYHIIRWLFTDRAYVIGKQIASDIVYLFWSERTTKQICPYSSGLQWIYSMDRKPLDSFTVPPLHLTAQNLIVHKEN